MKKGFTILEVLIAVGLFAMIVIGMTAFIGMIYKTNDVLYSQLAGQKDARTALSIMVKELRSANNSSIGSYVIDTAASSTLIFYSDIDADTYKERVRYFVDGTTLKKGVIKPAGTPLAYNPASEVVTTLANNLVSASAPFQYFNETYDGAAAGLLAQPVKVTDVHYVRITLTIDRQANVSPLPLTASTEVEIRNLKTY